ncbi:MAG: hypothetical protein AB7F96_21765 [Beijerinckiaceae bacterium]
MVAALAQINSAAKGRARHKLNRNYRKWRTKQLKNWKVVPGADSLYSGNFLILFATLFSFTICVPDTTPHSQIVLWIDSESSNRTHKKAWSFDLSTSDSGFLKSQFLLGVLQSDMGIIELSLIELR